MILEICPMSRADPVFPANLNPVEPGRTRRDEKVHF